jgi:pimeloyl-ACP methyl ester carboxylesterase
MTSALTYTESGSGPAVVLLHAYPLDARMWDAQREALSDTYRVITPNLRGFGGSPLHDDPHSLDLVADDVVALLDRIGLDRVSLGGLSLGGYVAMALLRRHAQRVNAVAFIDTKATADPDAARNNRERIAQTLIDEASPRVLVDDALPGLLGETTHRERFDVVQRATAYVRDADPVAAAWMQRAMAARPDSVPTLEELEEPAIVIVGDEDGVTPVEQAAIMNDALPHSTLQVIAGCGHLAALERPDELTALLREFLASVHA